MIRMIVLAVLLSVQVAQAQDPCPRRETQKYSGTSQAGPGSHLGQSLALGKDLALVGVPGGDSQRGFVQVLSSSKDSWQKVAELRPTIPGGISSHAGKAVGLLGHYGSQAGSRGALAVVGENSGVHVFQSFSGLWDQVALLSPRTIPADPSFGDSLAVHRDSQREWISVGAPGEDLPGLANAGAVYVYRWDGSHWAEESRIVAGDASANQAFGRAVAVRGNLLLVGSIGSVYAFEFQGGSWTFLHKFTPQDTMPGDGFGASLSMWGNTALIGAPNHGDSYQGQAYLFEFDGQAWMETSILQASDAQPGDQFGLSLSLHQEKDRMAIASPNRNASKGGVYLFSLEGGLWREKQILTASDALAGDRLGEAVVIHEDEILAGAPNEEYENNGACLDSDPFSSCDIGSAYFFGDLDLVLEMGPSPAINGDLIHVSLCGGSPGQRTLLFLSHIDHSPVFLPTAAGGLFDGRGIWEISSVLGGVQVSLDVGFQALSLNASAQPVFSNEISIVFN